MHRYLLAILTALWVFFAHAESANDNPPIDGISFRYVESNGIKMRIAEAGLGPTVLMAHGFPESWYSWRHQIKALADAGFHAVAPDMRGYGLTDAPIEAKEYLLDTLALDMIGILDALNVERAHMVGHDWGSPVASHTVVSYPERFNSLVLLSVPYGPRSPVAPYDAMKQRFGDNFFYMLYHNEPGVAEAEYDANAREFLFSIYQSPTSPRHPPKVTDPKRSAGGWLPRLGTPLGLPEWLSQADLDYVVGQFERSGFKGGVNYYRNFNQNWEASANIKDPVVRVPMMFMAGTEDLVIAGATAKQLEARMSTTVENLVHLELLPGIGHWIQQEAPAATNAAMLKFYNSLVPNSNP